MPNIVADMLNNAEQMSIMLDVWFNYYTRVTSLCHEFLNSNNIDLSLLSPEENIAECSSVSEMLRNAKLSSDMLIAAAYYNTKSISMCRKFLSHAPTSPSRNLTESNVIFDVLQNIKLVSDILITAAFHHTKIVDLRREFAIAHNIYMHVSDPPIGGN